jgi:hypothetical protein
MKNYVKTRTEFLQNKRYNFAALANLFDSFRM